jgi:hypothetical protein
MADDLWRPRWRGQAGRLEVWYTTLTDPATGTGVWLHHELVAPSDGAPAYGHGWIGVFPPDEPPAMARFGPTDWTPPDEARGFDSGGVTVSGTRLAGSAGELGWDLTAAGGGPPLFTFPRWAWRREVLPAAQVVAAPAAAYSGTVKVGASELRLADAPGATGRIYGHGNALRWAWLHADLGGGDVLEIVAAISTRPAMRFLRPLPFVRLRIDGTDWPSTDPLLAAWRFQARIDLPRWSVTGRWAGRRLRVDVEQPPERTLAVPYRDPDGRPAVCHNSERSSASIVLERRTQATWAEERRWMLAGTAHAEVGLRA